MTLHALFEIHPPPWKVEKYAFDVLLFDVRDARGMLIQAFRGEDEAIARLLAAAPGLVAFAESQAAESPHAHQTCGGCIATSREARAALAALKEE